MKQSLLVPALMMVAIHLGPVPAHAAIRKSDAPMTHLSETQAGVSKNENKRQEKWLKKKSKLEKKLGKAGSRKSGWFSGLFKFPAKWLGKLFKKPERSDAARYLLLAGILLLAAILFFALNGISPVFNYFGSVSAITAAIFFVLWLIAFTE